MLIKNRSLCIQLALVLSIAFEWCCFAMALVITIASKENTVHADSDAVLLRVPNKLLFGWYQSNTAATWYVSLVNDAILDKLIQLKPECGELGKKIPSTSTFSVCI